MNTPKLKYLGPDDGRWGHHIEMMGYYHVSGHMTPKPEVGDYIAFRHANGTPIVYKLTKMTTFTDPPDMFWADMKQSRKKFCPKCREIMDVHWGPHGHNQHIHQPGECENQARCYL